MISESEKEVYPKLEINREHQEKSYKIINTKHYAKSNIIRNYKYVN